MRAEKSYWKIEMSKKIEEMIRELVGCSLENRKKDWVPGTDWILYSGNYFDNREYESAIKCLLDGWLGLGEIGSRFERKFSSLMSHRYGIFVNSGSSANLLMVSALKSKRLSSLATGSKIITPAAGFPTTVNPILQNGFEPVFIDIEVDTLNMDLNQLEDAAKKGASALIFAHVLGNPPNMDDVMDISEKHGLIVLEDCCDALGSKWKGRPLGSFGYMSSCSFYPAHHITTGEGGMVCCSHSAAEMVVRSLRDWGRGCYCSGKASACLKNGMCKKRYSAWIPEMPDVIMDHKYIYEEIGYNLKPMEMQAAIGMEQLAKLDSIIEARKRNFDLLMSIFSPYESLFHIPQKSEHADVSWFAFPITVKDGAGFSRTDLSVWLEDHKIQTRNYFGGNMLLQPGYTQIRNVANPLDRFPVSTKVTRDTMFLGTSPVISAEQIGYIEEVLKDFLNQIKKIK